jgi:hypothetical protein
VPDFQDNATVVNGFSDLIVPAIPRALDASNTLER